jgi:hypothetical protein
MRIGYIEPQALDAFGGTMLGDILHMAQGLQKHRSSAVAAG